MPSLEDVTLGDVLPYGLRMLDFVVVNRIEEGTRPW